MLSSALAIDAYGCDDPDPKIDPKALDTDLEFFWESVVYFSSSGFLK